MALGYLQSKRALRSTWPSSRFLYSCVQHGCRVPSWVLSELFDSKHNRGTSSVIPPRAGLDEAQKAFEDAQKASLLAPSVAELLRSKTHTLSYLPFLCFDVRARVRLRVSRLKKVSLNYYAHDFMVYMDRSRLLAHPSPWVDLLFLSFPAADHFSGPDRDAKGGMGRFNES